jgi:hypothetical protein
VQRYSFYAFILVHYQTQHLVPLKWFPAFLLVAETLASVFITMTTKGRPVTDAQNDAALEKVSARSLWF